MTTTSTAPEYVHEPARLAMRRATFLYQDGVVLCATVRALDELGLIAPAVGGGRTVAELCPEVSQGGWGYLRVGLRTLAGEGWLEAPPTDRPQTTVISWTDAGQTAMGHRRPYGTLGTFLADFTDPGAGAWGQSWSEARTESFGELVRAAAGEWSLGDIEDPLRAHVRMHLDGAIAIPAMLALRGSGALGDGAPMSLPGAMGRSVAALLELLGFTDATGHWTDRGRLAAEFSAYWGIVGSYLPLLARLPDLYRGEGTAGGAGSAPGEAPMSGPEWHVNRPLNVIASAAAHRRYFSDADSIILEVFGREPAARPRFVADIGCGDGSWLVHIDRLLAERGSAEYRSAPERPLMVGIDCNELALEEARGELQRAGVDALLLWGDVSDPDDVAHSLAEHGLEMGDGLHIRAFVDHDRGYRAAPVQAADPAWSSGAYVDRDGAALAGADVERDLREHLRRWTPYAVRHGLVVLEAHCVEPKIASRHLGALHSVAFDAYHGYSHQYPVEYAAFLRCLREAGLARATQCERGYPSSRPFVAVSLNRLMGPQPDGVLPAIDADCVREDTWRPPTGTDLADGRGLHELLYSDGDLRHPRQWSAPATGWVVARALEVIERRLATAEKSEAIRVLDYGTGTGLAAIELLKACRLRGIDQRLATRGVPLELHLADLPSSWFAQGYELLRGCPWTRFHSLQDERGAFRPLLEVTRGRRVDVVISNMVFHLVPPAALTAVAGELASVLRPGGALVWSSPDLGPAGEHAVLFHDANRAVRTTWLELLAGGGGGSGRRGAPGAQPAPASGTRGAAAVDAALSAAASLSASDLRSAGGRAERRILSRAHTADQVIAALGEYLNGEVEFRAYEMLDDEILDALLVPSNQAEYLAEIADRDLREAVIRTLMCDRVLPAMREGPAGTGLGLGVHWTLGCLGHR